MTDQEDDRRRSYTRACVQPRRKMTEEDERRQTYETWWRKYNELMTENGNLKSQIETQHESIETTKNELSTQIEEEREWEGRLNAFLALDPEVRREQAKARYDARIAYNNASDDAASFSLFDDNEYAADSDEDASFSIFN